MPEMKYVIRGIVDLGNCPLENCLSGNFQSGKYLQGTVCRGNVRRRKVLRGNVRRGTTLEPKFFILKLFHCIYLIYTRCNKKQYFLCSIHNSLWDSVLGNYGNLQSLARYVGSSFLKSSKVGLLLKAW